MAVEKRWIRNAVISLSVILLLFVILQLSLSGYVNVNTIRTTATVQANSAVEYTDIAMFITPTVWLGIAAAVSRHRGVYIALTIHASLSLLSSIGFLVYEGFEFGTNAYYTSFYGMDLQAVMITKLVTWSIITLILIILLGVTIAADCARGRPEFNYYKQPGRESVPPYSSPPDYAPRLVKTLPYDSPRDHPVKYTDYQPFRSRGYDYQPSPRGYEYPAAPRAYYPKY